jgi:hypothetical protein
VCACAMNTLRTLHEHAVSERARIYTTTWVKRHKFHLSPPTHTPGTTSCGLLRRRPGRLLARCVSACLCLCLSLSLSVSVSVTLAIAFLRLFSVSEGHRTCVANVLLKCC